MHVIDHFALMTGVHGSVTMARHRKLHVSRFSRMVTTLPGQGLDAAIDTFSTGSASLRIIVDALPLGAAAWVAFQATCDPAETDEFPALAVGVFSCAVARMQHSSTVRTCTRTVMYCGSII